MESTEDKSLSQNHVYIFFLKATTESVFEVPKLLLDERRRNTEGKIYGTYLGYIHGIYIYIYVEHIRNIHEYLWDKIIRNTSAAFGGRPIGSVFLIILYHKCLWTCLIYSSYIPHINFLNMFHIFSLLCFLIHGVKSSSGHDQMTTFDTISDGSVPKPSS